MTEIGRNEGTMSLQDYREGPRYPARVRSSVRITPRESEDEVREIVLEIYRPEFEYELGQSLAVWAPGSPELGEDVHVRMYSVADLPERSGDARYVTICVRRCFYIDDYSGERYPGIASNYLCDLGPGDVVTLSGPFGMPFPVPEEHDASLILIGSGTGIAPFRVLVKHIYGNVPDWTGRIWLLHGARSGLELLYMNQEKDDFAQYYDRETFEAFRALSPRPHWDDPIGWETSLEDHLVDLWAMLREADTYVYVAGLEKSLAQLDGALCKAAGSPDRWHRRKAEMAAGGRWLELIY